MICSRCKRERDEKYLTRQKKYGKIKVRCKARSYCATYARRRKKQAPFV